MSPKDIEQAGSNLYWQLQQGRISRRQFMPALAATGLGAVGASVLAACGTPAPVAAPVAATAAPVAAATAAPAVAAERPFTPTFYQWSCSGRTPLTPTFYHDRGPTPRHQGHRQPEVPGPQLPDCPDARVRCGALHRRSQDRGEHLGCLRRRDPLRRDGTTHRQRRDRAMGSLSARRECSTTSSRRSARNARWTASSTSGPSCWT